VSIESVGNAYPFLYGNTFLLPMLILFDVEVIFLYPWAINFEELGMEEMI
jgi:NADH-quinone oxidoreductase subunit A